jgi:hypothetical protein
LLAVPNATSSLTVYGEGEILFSPASFRQIFTGNIFPDIPFHPSIPPFTEEGKISPSPYPLQSPAFQSKDKEEFLFMRVGVGFRMVSNVFTKMRCTPRHVPLESLLLDLLEHRGNETANLFSSISLFCHSPKTFAFFEL